MTERPIILNAEQVRSVLAGRKTQHRIPVKFPFTDRDIGCELSGNELAGEIAAGNYLNSKFGKPGDRLWVRETFSCIGNEDGNPVDAKGNLCIREDAQRIYRASAIQKPNNYGLWTSPDGFDFEGDWTPSIHMPRWASRITLEITGVRVERLNSISQEDAQAEGMELTGWRPTYSDPDSGGDCQTPYDNFAELWESIYGVDSWQANPWVWVIEFKRVEDE
ncbi:morphogenetic protein [Tatumella morbirosei]|uniref:Morphogenetic protein n=1 Tax=Tatumella morbirosei TaxID=642227 RepID=A0A095ULB9_9GAMM|nr:morphogenetic protein [Tatumella morbirosei]KGD75243.1 morphogenetic protein [Tatumella morbirosei]